MKRLKIVLICAFLVIPQIIFCFTRTFNNKMNEKVDVQVYYYLKSSNSTDPNQQSENLATKEMKFSIDAKSEVTHDFGEDAYEIYLVQLKSAETHASLDMVNFFGDYSVTKKLKNNNNTITFTSGQQIAFE
jgi:hypothetical protein